MNAWQKAVLEGQVSQMKQINLMIKLLREIADLLVKIEKKS